MLDSLGAFIVFFAALFCVAERGNITGGFVGVALTYAMQVRCKLEFCISKFKLAQYLVKILYPQVKNACTAMSIFLTFS